APAPHDRMPGPLRDDPAIDAVGLARAAHRLKRRLQRLAKRLSDACDDVDAAAKAMEDLEERLVGVPELGRWHRVARSPEERRIMRAEAKAGASSLEVLRHADGRSEVSVNGRP